MPTSTRYPRAQPVPLDLADIHKTQRRVAALMQAGRPKKMLGASSSWKRIPHSYCYVCSKLDPDGRFMGNPYKYIFGRGYLQRCEHIPPAPHPTILGDSRPNSVSSSDDGKYFDTRILNSDSLPGDNSTRFRIPPVFDKDLRSRAGRVLPLVSENTFQSTNPQRSESNRNYDEYNRKGDATRFSLPSLPNGKQPALVSRNSYQGNNEKSVVRSREMDETSSRGDSFAVDHRSHYDSENSMGGRVRVDQKGRRLPPLNKAGFAQRPAGTEQWADEEEAEGVMKYQHRKKEDRIGMSRPSDSFDDSKYQRSSNSKELYGATGSRDYMDSPSGSARLSGGSPQYSRGTPESSPDFVFSRMKSASWCECPDVEVGSLRCRECFRTGGHEKWCVSKLGICPKCNKPVRRKHSRDRLRRQGTFSPVAARNPTDLSVESSWHNREECSSRRQEDHKVRFHDSESNSFVKEKKKKRGGILKHDPEESRFEFAEEIDVAKRLKRAEASVNAAVPRVNPNVHKRAYLMALADARLRKLTKDPLSLESAFRRRYFSYFPLYKRPGFKATAEIGIRTEEDMRRGKKLKIKKGMKHIFGDIDLADYYPKTKRMPKESKVAA